VRLTNLRKSLPIGVTKATSALLRPSPRALRTSADRGDVMEALSARAAGDFFFMKRAPAPGRCGSNLLDPHDSGTLIDFR